MQILHYAPVSRGDVHCILVCVFSRQLYSIAPVLLKLGFVEENVFHNLEYVETAICFIKVVPDLKNILE